MIGKTGVHFRFHNTREYGGLSLEQKAEPCAYREANTKCSKPNPNKRKWERKTDVLDKRIEGMIPKMFVKNISCPLDEDEDILEAMVSLGDEIGLNVE